MAEPNVDPLALTVALAGWLLGPAVATLVGTYAFIGIVWVAGVMVGLFRRDPDSRLRPRRFVAISAILTFGLTVPCARWLGLDTGAPSSVALFAVAFLIPAVGESWIGVVRDFYEARIKPAFAAFYQGKQP